MVDSVTLSKSASQSVLVVGGSPERPSPELVRTLACECRLVLAADGGADACRAAGVHVDVLLGDADSMSEEALLELRSKGVHEVPFGWAKDSTDLELAVRWVRENVADLDEAVFTGVSGGRSDHALAAFGSLARAADLRPRIEEDGCTAWVLSPGNRASVGFSPTDVHKTLSVLALLGPATVTETGMLWNVEQAELAPLSDLGVSNMVEAENAAVAVHEGVALVVVQREVIPKRALL